MTSGVGDPVTPLDSRTAQRLAFGAIAFGLVAPWWLPWLAIAVPTFYKEWLFVVALAFGGLILPTMLRPTRRRARIEPLLVAAGLTILVVLVQALVLEGVWRRAVLTVAAAAVFAYSIVLGQALHDRRDDALDWIATWIVVAALGSCVFAALQLLVPGLPFVIPRAGGRLFGNVAQANHFVDLLWIGSVAVAWRHARGRTGIGTALALVVTMQIFGSTGGSRMAWLYALVLAGMAGALWLRRSKPPMRRLGVALAAVVVIYLLVTTLVSATGVLDRFGVTSAERRATSGESTQSTAQRLWFWHVGLDVAHDHPLLGAGVGRFAGEGLARAMGSATSPPAPPDAQAHNVFIQLAAECGVPLAVGTASLFLVWLVRLVRRGASDVEAMGVLALASPLVIHANLEHPLGYMYLLGLLGLLVGQAPTPSARRSTLEVAVDSTRWTSPPELFRFASFAILAGAAFAYGQYTEVERAAQTLAMQMRAGAPPQPSRDFDARLAAVPRWSIFGDYAELLALIAAVPTIDNAAGIAQRCEGAIAIGPTPQLLARCATAFQVAGRVERASYYANALCRIYPRAAPVLIESMAFVERSSPTVADLRSTCVHRAD